jgi:uncharacterized protein (DUF1330 family)
MVRPFDRWPIVAVATAGRWAKVRQDDRVSAYWISIYQQITDNAKVEAYAELAGPALRSAGGTYLARGLPEEAYESGELTRTVVIAFDSVDAARAAHDSPAYQDALAALDGGAVRDMRIVPGVA